MGLSRLTLNVPRRNREVDPEAIFKNLTLRGTIENIWTTQAEALRAWHQGRTRPDVVIEMNTGGGKTLVELLIAQSIVNETQGHVLHICPTNQLVEQVAMQAGQNGMDVATYMGGRWGNREVYDRSTGPCITNYAALFNGKSIFKDEDLAGVVFDDAHVAGDVIRQEFTLRFPYGHSVFNPLVDLFRSHFVRNFHSASFESVLQGDSLAVLFVPMFVVAQQHDMIMRLLRETKHDGQTVDEATDTLFAWEHVKNHLRYCVFLLSGAAIEITPPVLPVKTLRCFQGTTRRVYATATLPAQTEFLRTFGVADYLHIVPSGKSGEAQRQFLFMPGESEDEQREQAKELIESRKACIITPSVRAAGPWCPPAERYEGTKGNAGIVEFAHSKEPRKLLIAGRFDGIDLPGDACRILVIDRLPEAGSLLERFMDQSLRIERLRLAHTARRVVQAIGRIFRSNTDHGAVLVCGNDLQRWLQNPINRRYFPPLLQQQIQLGISLRNSVDKGETTPEELLNAILGADREWDDLYRANVTEFDTNQAEMEPEWLRDLVLGETEAYTLLWQGNHRGAADRYAALATDARENDKSLSGWYEHWRGIASQYAGDREVAEQAFVLAANVRYDLGRPAIELGAGSRRAAKASPQAVRIEELLNSRRGRITKMIESVKESLQYGPQTASLEQAVHDLGLLLGLKSLRPDKDQKTGPDVLWIYEEKQMGVAIEAKTDKAEAGSYSKHEIGQYHDHLQWLRGQFPEDYTFHKAILGRTLRVVPEANPPEDLRIIEIEAFNNLLERVRELYTFVQDAAPEGSVAEVVERGLRQMGLTFPACVEALPGQRALDLKP